MINTPYLRKKTKAERKEQDPFNTFNLICAGVVGIILVLFLALSIRATCIGLVQLNKQYHQSERN